MSRSDAKYYEDVDFGTGGSAIAVEPVGYMSSLKSARDDLRNVNFIMENQFTKSYKVFPSDL